MQEGDFYLAGWRIRSHVSLPDLPLWTGDERHPDICFFAGKLPESPSALRFVSPLLQIASDGSCWLAVPGLTSCFINSQGTEVILSGDEGNRSVLLSTALALLCHKRGLLPLHASCVQIGDHAVAFAGPSCAGKSLLAAALAKVGCAIVSDDVTVVDTAAEQGPVALASFPRLRLWRDAIEKLGLDGEERRQRRPELEKHDVATTWMAPEPRLLSAIYYLRPQRKGLSETTTRVQGVEAARYAAGSVWCAHAAPALTRGMQPLAQIAKFCAKASSHLLSYQYGYDAVPGRVAALLSRHGEHA